MRIALEKQGSDHKEVEMRRRHTVALFGEAEHGEYRTAYYVKNVTQLADCFGHPPEESQGLHYAVQLLMYERGLIYFRVREEGYSLEDYLLGLSFLQNRQMVPELSAICCPGVGDVEVLEATEPLLDIHRGILITNEGDLYDYLTQRSLKG